MNENDSIKKKNRLKKKNLIIDIYLIYLLIFNI